MFMAAPQLAYTPLGSGAALRRTGHPFAVPSHGRSLNQRPS
jgi:hypothetical protein